MSNVAESLEYEKDGQLAMTPYNAALLENIPEMQFNYVNHAGKFGRRRVKPLRIFHGTGVYYTDPQWLMECFDMEKQAIRCFALSKLNLVS